MSHGPIARLTITLGGYAAAHDEELCRLLPNARWDMIPRAGHLAPLETPRAFRDLVLDFLG